MEKHWSVEPERQMGPSKKSAAGGRGRAFAVFQFWVLNLKLTLIPVIVALLTAFPMEAAQRKVGNAGASTAFGGQKNVIYVPSVGYWIFFKDINADRSVWRFSTDGQDWTSSSDIFPYLQLAPDAAAPEPSVWHVPSLDNDGVTYTGRVYVSAGDATSDVNATAPSANLSMVDNSGNKMFVRWGKLRVDGGIDWDSATGIRRQRVGLRIQNAFCQYVENTTGSTVWDVLGGGKPAVVVYSSSTAGGYVALFGNARNAIATVSSIGGIGVTNLTEDLSGYIDGSFNVYAFCNENDAVATGSGGDYTALSPAGLSIAPVLDNGVANFFMGVRVDNSVAASYGGKGALVRLSSSSLRLTSLDGTPDTTGSTSVDNTNTLSATDALTILNPGVHGFRNTEEENNIEGFNFSIINEVAKSSAHIAYIDNLAGVAYRRKTAPTTVTAPIVLVSSPAGGTGSFPPQSPAITLVNNAKGQANYNEVYVLWVSSDNAAIRYRVGPATATADADFGATTTFKTGTGLNYPKVGFSVDYPKPIGIIWEASDGVYFDKIITSTWIPPVISAVSSAPASAPYSAQAYDLVVDDSLSGFRTLGNEKPDVKLLVNDEVDDDIAITSVTFVSNGQIKVSVIVSTFVQAGTGYTLRVTNPDGQEVSRSSAITINKPTITSIRDTDANNFTSCGIFPNNDGTTNKSCKIMVSGNYFQNWTGITGTTVLPSTNAVAVLIATETANGVTVSSLAYTGTPPASVDLFLKISTQNAAGVYTFNLTNPSSGSVLQPTTFYITVPTASISAPMAGVTTGFTVIVGSFGYTPNVGQATNDTSQIKITYLGTPRKVWNGSSMKLETDTGEFPTEEAKWKDVGSQFISSWTYTFIATNTVAVPDDGDYEILARARTSDGGIGEPFKSPFFSTVAVVLDRKPPSWAITSPGNDAAINTLAFDPVIQVSDLGAGLTTVEMLIQDIGLPQAAETNWQAFNSTGTLGSAPAGTQIWLSTNAGDSSKTIFNFVRTTQTITTNGTATAIDRPLWEDGHQYRISIKATDSRFIVDTSSGGADAFSWRFIYDITAPTVTLATPAPALLYDTTDQADAGNPLKTLSSIDGTVQDNVSGETRDDRVIWVRMARLDVNNLDAGYLDPTKTSDGDSSPDFVDLSGDAQWKKIEAQGTDNWNWDISGLDIADSDATYPFYRLDVFAKDEAGNSTGSVASPVYRRFFKLDKTAPTLSFVEVSSTAAAGVGYPVLDSQAFYGLLADGSTPIFSIRGSAADSNGISTVSWRVCWNGDGACDQYFDDQTASSWTNTTAKWYNARTTTTPSFQVWQATGIPWINGRIYKFSVTAWDNAGNQVSTITRTFGFDTVAPDFEMVNFTSGTTYGSQLPTQFEFDVIDCPQDSARCVGQHPSAKNAGVLNTDIFAGVQRNSDGYWYSDYTVPPGGCVGQWCPEALRKDYNVSSISGSLWKLTAGASFWASRNTETYKVHVWTQDQVNAAYRNKTSSQTQTAIFHWETQAPSSTLITPILATCDTSNVGEWYSDISGFTLPQILGTAFDRPTASTDVGYGPSPVTIIDDQLESIGHCGALPCETFQDFAEAQIKDTALGTCWDGTEFPGTQSPACGPSTWRQMTFSATSWTYPTSVLWPLTATGRRYEVRMRGKDNAIDTAKPPTKTDPVDDGIVYESNPNIESIIENTRNCRSFRVDKTSPTATFTTIVHNTQYSTLSTITGAAADSGTSGTVALSSHVQVAYWVEESDATNGNCSPPAGSLQRFWNTATQSYDVAGSSNAPPSSAWINVTSFDGSEWTATGTSTPTFTNACEYQVYVRAIDKVGLKTNVPAAPGSGLARVLIKFSPVTPQAVITLPSADDAYFRLSSPNALTMITGTASDATNVRVQVIVSTSDAIFPEGGGDAKDNLCWSGPGSGNAWIECDSDGVEDGTFNFSKANSTYVAVSVNTVPNPDEWSFGNPFPGGFPGAYDDNKLWVRIQAFQGNDDQPGLPQRVLFFDTTNPNRGFTVPFPSSAAFKTGELNYLAGTAQDPTNATTASGMDNSTFKFRIVLASNTSTAWCPELSAYADVSACSGSNEDILGNFTGGVNYSTAPPYTSWPSTGPWRDGYRFKVILGPGGTLKDLAQNAPSELESHASGFRYDLQKPTASITLPLSDVGKVSSLSVLSGTVADVDPSATSEGVDGINASGIFTAQASSGVAVKIIRDDGFVFDAGGPPYWPDNDSGDARWFAATGVGDVNWDSIDPDQTTWTYTHAELNTQLANNRRYTILTRARDKAGNQQNQYLTTTISSVTVAIDKEAPVLSITDPLSNQEPYNAIATGHSKHITVVDIKGTAQDGPSDTKAGFKVALGDVDVQLWYLNNSTSYYWNDTIGGWQAAVTSFPVAMTNQTNWSFEVGAAGCSPGSGCIDWGVSISTERVYYAAARARDNAVDGSSAAARNISPFLSTRTFVVDTLIPSSTFTVPGVGINFVNTLADLSGTADGGLSGFFPAGNPGGKVELKILHLTGAPEYWAGSSWTATETWSTGTVVSNNGWKYDRLPVTTVTSGDDYRVSLRTYDRAGNQSVEVTRDFRVDFTSPTVKIKLPDQNEGAGAPYSNSIVNAESTRTITTTLEFCAGSTGNCGAGDADASGLAEGWLAVSSGTGVTMRWWDQATASFTVVQTTVHWNQGTSLFTSSFVYTQGTLGSVLRDGITYRVYAKAKDVAGNWKGAGSFETADTSPLNCEDTGVDHICQEFRYDLTRPVSTITQPDTPYENLISSFSGTITNAGSNPSAIKRARVAVKCLEGSACTQGGGSVNNYWDWGAGAFLAGNLGLASAWTEAPIVGLTWSTSPVLTAMLVSGSTYTVIARIQDHALNEEQDGDAQGSTFLYDTVAPTTTLTLPRPSTYYYSLPEITGTFSETLSNMTTVQILLQKEGPTACWDGSVFVDPCNASFHWRGATLYSSSWSIAAPVSLLTPGVNYWVQARGQDGAGNKNFPDAVPTQGDSVKFTWDTLKPVSVTTTPANSSAFARTFASVYGTASDTGGAGAKGVTLRVRRSDGDYYSRANEVCGDNLWDSASSNFPIGTTLTGGANWSVANLASCKFEEGYRYEAISRSRDNSRNATIAEGDDTAYSQYEIVYTTNTFVIDFTTPTHAITQPVTAWPALGFVKSISTFTGTVNDRIDDFVFPIDDGFRNYEAGIGTRTADRSIHVAIQHRTDGKWWDVAADSFSVTYSTPHWQYGVAPSFYNDGTSLAGQSSGTWEFYVNPNDLQNNTSYYINVRTRDLVDNYEVDWSTRVFTVDTSTPSTALVEPANACPTAYDTLTEVTGTADDPPIGELSVVSLRFHRIRDQGVASDTYWNGASWQGSEVWIDSGTVSAPTSATWDYDLPVGFLTNDSEYEVTARAKDKAGNVHGFTLPVVGTFDRCVKFSETAPVTTLSAPGSTKPRFKRNVFNLVSGGSTNSQAVQVRVIRESDKQQWDQINKIWVSSSPDFWNPEISTGAGGNWNWSISTDAFSGATNSTYTIKSMGRSPGSVYEGGSSGNAGRLLVVDEALPTGGIVTPGNNAILNSLTQITGTATDVNDWGRVTTSGVKIRIQNAGTGNCWNSGAWAGCGGPSDIPTSFAGVECEGAACANIQWSTQTHTNGWNLESGYFYDIFLRPTDEAGNLNDTIPSFRVTYDTTPPVAVTTQPVPNNVYRELLQLAGTAVDPADGASPRDKIATLDRVEIQIIALDDLNKQWGGSSFDFYADSWVVVSGTHPWSYDAASLNANLATGRYVIKSRGRDKANNQQTVYSTVDNSSFTFYVDRASPTAIIVQPAHNTNYKSTQLQGLGALSGTASDPQAAYYASTLPELGVTQFKTWYLDAGTSYYFYGSSFSAGGEFWDNATNSSSSPWTRTLGAVWVSDKQYYIQARARDRALATSGALSPNIQNEFGVPSGNSSYHAFKVDDTVPFVVVDTPSAGSFNNGLGFEIHGRVNGDAVGLKVASSSGVVARLFCEDAVDRYFWDWNSSWVLAASTHVRVPTYSLSASTQIWNITSNLPTQGQFVCPVSTGTFKIGVNAVDVLEQLAAATTVHFTMDINSGTVVSTLPIVNAGLALGFYGGAGGTGVSAKPIATIAGTAIDVGVADINQVHVAISTGPGGSESFYNGAGEWTLTGSDEARWRLASGTSPWVYPAGGDTLPPWQSGRRYRVYSRMTDKAGNKTSESASVQFLYDTQVPSATLLSPLFSGTTMVKFLTMISGTAEDSNAVDPEGDLSGAATAEARIDRVQISIQDLTAGGQPYWDAVNQNWPGPEIWNSTTAITFTGNDSPRFADPWEFTGSTPTWIPGREYRIRARAVDRANNVSSLMAVSTITFIFDDAPPTQAVSVPFDGSAANYASPRLSTGAVIATMSGSASDSIVGIKETKIRVFTPDIDQAGGGRYWAYGNDYGAGSYSIDDGAGESAWFLAKTPYENWTSTFQFLNDTRYRIEARSEDRAGNLAVTYATVTLTIDRTVPVVTSTFPVTLTTIRDLDGLGFISGTFRDGGADPDTVGVALSSNVKIAVRVLTNPTSWFNTATDDFDQTQVNPFDNSIVGADSSGLSHSSWTFANLNNDDLVSGSSYFITIRADDESVPKNALSHHVVVATFTFDNTAPAVTISTPAAVTRIVNSFVRIRGTAADATSAVSAMYLKVQRVSDAKWLKTFASPCTADADCWGTAVATFTAAGTDSWSYPGSDWADNTHWSIKSSSDDFRVYAWGVDVPGSTSSVTGPNLFRFDVTLPTATITYPANGANVCIAGCANVLNAISGTAADLTAHPTESDSNIRLVEVAFSSNSGFSGSWWDGSSFTAVNPVYFTTSSWNDVADPDSWEAARPPEGPGRLENGKTYAVRVRVTDKAGNPRVMPTDISFKFDSGAPVAGILDPTMGSFKQSLSIISGTSQDTGAIPGTISNVYIAVSTGTGPEWYWNFNTSAWVSSESSTSTIATDGDGFGETGEDWNFSGPFPPWADLDNKIVKIYVWARDQAGNEGSHSVSYTTFTVDRTIANSSTTFPAFGSIFSSLTLSSGTVSDPNSNASGINKVEVAIEREADSGYWNPATQAFVVNNTCGAGADPCVIWSTAPYFTSSWTFTWFNTGNFNPNNWYRFKQKPTDNAGNASTIEDTDIDASGVRVYIDTSAPVSVTTAPALAAGTTSYYNYIPIAVYGTSSDTGFGTRQIGIRMSRVNSAGTRGWHTWFDNQWNSGDQGFPQNVSAPLATWVKSLDPAHFAAGEGYSYQIQTQGRDFAKDTNGNFTNNEVVVSTAYYVLDYSTPTIESVTFSTQALNYFRTIALASGTVNDPVPGGGVSAQVDLVSVELEDISDEFGRSTHNATFWDFSAGTWTTAAPVPPLAAQFTQSSWSFTNLPATQVLWERGDPSPAGRRYRLKMRVRDRATNITSFTDKYANLAYDATPATSTITVPPIGSPPDAAVLEGLTTISGTAVDPSTGSIKQVYISIRNNSTNNQGACPSGLSNVGKYCTGVCTPAGGWTTTETWLPVTSFNQGPQQEDWSYTFDGQWENDCYYTVRSSGVDTADNYQTVLSSRGFQIVAPAAVTVILVPQGPPQQASVQYYRSLAFISGTADAASTNEVRLQIQRRLNNDYWNEDGPSNPGFWNPAFASNTVNGVGSWDYSPSGNDRDLPIFLDGSSYTIRSVGRNNAGLFENDGSGVSKEVRIDTTPPNTFLMYPGAADYYQNLAILSGTASDASPNGPNVAGILDAQLLIQRASDSKYYENSGDTWTTNSNSWAQNAAVWWGSSWTFTVNSPTTAWTDGVQYTIQARARDNALHTSGGANNFNVDPTPASKVLKYDVARPTGTITSITHNEEYSFISISSGTHADNFPPGDGTVSQVRLYLHDMSVNRYWGGNPLAWGATGVVRSTTSNVFFSSWSFTVPGDLTDNRRYALWTEAEDLAGNVHNTFNVGNSSLTFIMDMSGPAMAISNVGSSARRSTASLTSIDGTIVDPNHPANAKVDGVEDVEIQIYYVIGADTYTYRNNCTYSSDTVNIDTLHWYNPNPAGGFTQDGPSSGTWTYNEGSGGAICWLTDKSYTIRVRGKDNALGGVNTGTIVTLADVVIDTTVPTSVIDTPNDTVIRTLSSIAGTANGDLAGLNRVEFSLQQAMTPPSTNYFNGSGFTSDATVYFRMGNDTGGGTVSWSSATSASLLTSLADGSTYTIRVYATDNVEGAYANTQKTKGTYPVRTFLWDETAPTLAISSPVSADVYGPLKTLPQIKGTAGDVHSWVAGVELQVRMSTTTDFSGSGDRWLGGAGAFDQASTSWVYVSGGLTNWTHAVTWNANRRYGVTARATDRAGNQTTASEIAFVYDSTAPVITLLSNPSTFYHNTGDLATLSGTAHDTDAGIEPKVGLKRLESSISAQPTGAGSVVYRPDSGGCTNIDYSNPARWRLIRSTIAVGTGELTENWDYPTSAGDLYDDAFESCLNSGTTYQIEIRAIDKADNTSTVKLSSFVWDNTAPTLAIVDPNSSRESSLTQITGTANDLAGTNPGFLYRVWVRISQNSGGSPAGWWNRATQEFDGILPAEAAWFVPDTPNNFSSWSTTQAVNGFLVTGTEYGVHAKSSDTASNSTIIAASTFTWDTNAPVSITTFPVDASYINQARFNAIAGTAADTGTNPGCVNQVRVAVRQLGLGDDAATMFWWRNLGGNFDTAQADPLWQTTSVTLDGCPSNPATWIFTAINSGHLVSGTSYYALAEARDNSNLTETNFATGVSTFVYDNDKPETYITGPVHLSTRSALAQVAGTMQELPNAANKINAGIDQTQVTIQRMSDGQYWTGSGWGALTWLATMEGAGTWDKTTGLPSIGDLSHNTTYWIVARSSDNANNVEDSFAVATDSVSILTDLFWATATVTNRISTFGAGPFYYNPTINFIAGTSNDSP
ncbi:MAG: hypothetical protein HYT79_03030, partial [Elusimicrobia bacterium]|nr:hypothetical protein [Elusimicrobiota bacterium]